MYTNAPPHIGFALELIQADVLARYHRMMGDEVLFLTGTDEHGTKNARAAEAAGMEPQLFVDDITAQVRQLAENLDISNTDFIRTTDKERHWPAVEKFWNKLADNDDLYKRVYEGYYCVGHEAFIKERELEDGRCPLHKTEPERIKEENWFFRLSKYTKEVKGQIERGEMAIVPEFREKEVLNLLDDAEDVSVSRPQKQVSWGIPVPNDPGQTIYVFAEALMNYISALDYAHDGKQFKDYWPANVHLIGKDIVRFHAVYWPAMLLAAGLELPRAVYVHGFINVDGQKMSKSIGNVIDPADLLERYSTDAARYYLLREIRSTDDSDFSWENIAQRYESDLANGLGNLVQRVSTLLGTLDIVPAYQEGGTDQEVLEKMWDDKDYHSAMSGFRLHEALALVWSKIADTNAYINLNEPWKQEGGAQERTLITAVAMINHIGWLLSPFMPITSKAIERIFGATLTEKIPEGTQFQAKKGEPLFPRQA